MATAREEERPGRGERDKRTLRGKQGKCGRDQRDCRYEGIGWCFANEQRVDMDDRR
jgi:hypothetical protein